MAEHKPTPEEQLLKLIENPDAQVGTQSGAKAAASKTGGKRKSLGDIFSGLPFFGKSKAKSAKTAGKPKAFSLLVSIRAVNRIVLVLVLLSGAYLIYDFFFMSIDERAFLAQVSTTDPIYPKLDVDLEDRDREVEYYLDPQTRRNPFVTASYQSVDFVEEESMQLPTPVSEEMARILDGIRLVGISWSGGIPTAMVEDATSGRTYFLKESQEIRGVKVQTITKDNIIVTYEGEEAILT